MFCKSCGKQIDDDSRFCSRCGTKQSIHNKPYPQNDTGIKKDDDTTEIIDDLGSPHPNKTEKHGQPINPDQVSSKLHIKNDSGIQHKTSDDENQMRFREKNFNIIEKPSSEKIMYDPDYKKEYEAIFAGIVMIIIFFVIRNFGSREFEDFDSFSSYQEFGLIFSIFIRIIAVSWIIKIAKQQNRDRTSWGFLAFLFPAITLIVIGTRKKLYANIDLKPELSPQQNCRLLTKKAKKFYKNKMLSEAIRFVEKAIELDPDNKEALNIYQISKEKLTRELNTQSSTQTVFRETTDNKLLQIVLTNNQAIGAKVNLEGLPASDGIYYYKSKDVKVVVEDGKVKERVFVDRGNGLTIEKTNKGKASPGDKAYLNTGEPAPSGVYKKAFPGYTVKITDGKVIQLT